MREKRELEGEGEGGNGGRGSGLVVVLVAGRGDYSRGWALESRGSRSSSPWGWTCMGVGCSRKKHRRRWRRTGASVQKLAAGAAGEVLQQPMAVLGHEPVVEDKAARPLGGQRNEEAGRLLLR